MIDVVYRFKVAPGKVEQALEWASKNRAYLKKAGLSGTLFLLRPITVEAGEIAFVERLASMSEYEKIRTKRRADSGYMAIAKELQGSDWYLGHANRIYEVVEVVE
jgi:hypothetical protein